MKSLFHVILITLGLYASVLQGAEQDPSRVTDPTVLYQIAIDDGRTEYDRRLAMSRLEVKTGDRDKTVQAAAYYLYGKALIDGNTPEQKKERQGLRYIERALNARSGDAAAFMALRINPATSDNQKAQALVLWAKAHKFGHESALKALEGLLPDDLAWLNDHVESRADQWLIREAGSQLNNPTWKIAYAYPVLILDDAGGRKPTQSDIAGALTALEEAVILKHDDARYLLGNYLTSHDLDAVRAKQLWEEAAKNGHQESIAALEQLRNTARDEVTEATAKPTTLHPVAALDSASAPSQTTHQGDQLNAQAVSQQGQSDGPANELAPKDKPTADPNQAVQNGDPSKTESMSDGAKNAFTVGVLGLCLFSLIVVIVSATGKVHMYLNSADVGLCVLVCAGGMVSMIANPNSKHAMTELYYGGMVVAAMAAIAVFFMGWTANRSPISAIIVFIPKLLLSWLILLLGLIAFGASMATLQNAKKGKVGDAVKMAGTAAAAGAGFFFLTKFIQKLMPPKNRVEFDETQPRPNMTNKVAVEPLIATLSDADPTARRTAAIALGELGDKRAEEALVAAAEDSNVAVRNAAAKALEKLRQST